MVGRANGIVLMAWPTEDQDAKSSVATLLSAIKPKQQVIVAESYGGSDEPVDDIVRALVGVEVDPLIEPLRVKDKPCESIYKVGWWMCTRWLVEESIRAAMQMHLH